jgi:hypothetical protein
MYRCVVLKSECPAIRMIASGDIRAPAAFVIPVCRQSWNSRIGFSIPVLPRGSLTSGPK